MIKSPQDVLLDISARFRARRLAMNLTQEGLSARSGVSWGSLKRFERSGLISLDALLRLALVLDCLDDFAKIAPAESTRMRGLTLDEILSAPKQRKKGRVK